MVLGVGVMHMLQHSRKNGRVDQIISLLTPQSDLVDSATDVAVDRMRFIEHPAADPSQ